MEVDIPQEHLVPRADAAVIEESKLVSYCLDPEHDKGRHKALVFESALGDDQTNWEQLRSELASGLRVSPWHKVGPGFLSQGRRYSVKMTIRGANGMEATVSTGWEVDSEGAAPRFLSAVVKGQAKPLS